MSIWPVIAPVSEIGDNNWEEWSAQVGFQSGMSECSLRKYYYFKRPFRVSGVAFIKKLSFFISCLTAPYMKNPDNPKFWIIDPEAAEIVKRIYRMTLDDDIAFWLTVVCNHNEQSTPEYQQWKGYPKRQQ